MVSAHRSWGVLLGAYIVVACSQNNSVSSGDGGVALDAGGDTSTGVPSNDSGVQGIDDASTDAADAGRSDAGDGGHTPPPSCITPATPQSCTAPVATALPICTLSETGCMD